ncbi:MAG: LysR family transcriptional regulator [Bacteroidia bacterium]|nr:LysR family transcriptional regulator [Bacteroidia bacterium]
MKSHKLNNFRVEYKIWLDDATGEGILGEGKIALLKHIEKTNSLVAAASELKVSYRKAWGDIKNAESLLGIQLIDRKRGGDCGGTSTLTDEAKKIVEAWDKLHQKVDIAVEDIIVEFKKFIKNK